MGGRLRWPRHLAMSIGALAVVALVVMTLVVLRVAGLQEAASVAQLVSVAFGVPALVVPLTLWWRRRTPRPSIDLGGPGPSSRIATDHAATELLREHLGRASALPTLVGDRAVGPLALRVHPAIPADEDAREDGVPAFVPREIQPRVSAWLRSARLSGGMLVLVGDSSVGKTRLLYETAMAELPEFQVLAPDLGNGEVVNSLSTAGFDLPPLIIWLDELQRFVDGPFLGPGGTAVRAGSVRRLLEADTPVVVLGTMWPEHARELRSALNEGDLGPLVPRYASAFDILDDSRCTTWSVNTFSRAERRSAALMARSDQRLADALSDRNFNVTEALAGAPTLTRRFEESTGDARAVVLGAVDAYRLGVRGRLSSTALRAAARGHLDQVRPGNGWFDTALAELSDRATLGHRGTAPLVGVPDAEHRSILGYYVADYLLQQLLDARRREPVPDAVWSTLIDTAETVDDLVRIADAASIRKITAYQLPALWKAATAGSDHASLQLAIALDNAQDVRELRRLTAAGNPHAAAVLGRRKASLAGMHVPGAGGGGSGEYTTRFLVMANPDYHLLDSTPWQLADLLVESGDFVELNDRAAEGDPVASIRLARIQFEQGAVDEALASIGPASAAGDVEAALYHAHLLVEYGHLQEAVDLLRTHTEQAHLDVSFKINEVLLLADDVDGLQQANDAGDPAAQLALVRALLARKDREALHNLAVPDSWATRALAVVASQEDDTDHLASVAGDDEFAADLLSRILHRRGDLDQLVERALQGDSWSRASAVQLATESRELPTLLNLFIPDDPVMTGLICLILATAQDVDLLEELAARDDLAARELARLLARSYRKYSARSILTKRLGMNDSDAEIWMQNVRDQPGESKDEAKNKVRAAIYDHRTNLVTDEITVARHLLLGESLRTNFAEHLYRERQWDLLTQLALNGDLEGYELLAIKHMEDNDIANLGLTLMRLTRAGCEEQTYSIVNYLKSHGRYDLLAAAANAGNRSAAWSLARHLDETSGLDELLRHAGRGDAYATDIASLHLTAQGRTAEALDLLRPWLLAGHMPLVKRYADLSAKRGDTETAVRVLRESVEAGDADAHRRTVRLMAEEGDIDQLRSLADNGDRYAARQLVDLLRKRGDIPALQSEVHAGNTDDAARSLLQIYDGSHLTTTADLTPPRN